MIEKILSIIVDYKSTEAAERLSLQLTRLKTSRRMGQVIHFDNGNFPPVSLSQAQIQNGVKYQRSEINLGYGGALNEAIRRLKNLGERFDAYWFLNSDLEITPSCLDKLTQVLNLHHEVAAVGPRVLDGRDLSRVWGARGVVSPLLGTTSMKDWKGGRLPENSYIPGCSLLIRARAFDQVGGLPTHYQLYYEETELCIRLQRQGWRLWVERSALVTHHVDSLRAKFPGRHFTYYFIRNNFIFWRSLFQVPWWLQLPRTLCITFKEVALPLRRSKSLDEFKDRIFCIGGGLWDGICMARKKPVHFERTLFP
jgi:GT2 family glycosyltransferase